VKTERLPQRYVSGPHYGDYYLLLDEQSDCILATRLAERTGEASAIFHERVGLATASLLEIWIDDTENHVWYVFEARCCDEANSRLAARDAKTWPSPFARPAASVPERCVWHV
jgi:hypothetical protein